MLGLIQETKKIILFEPKYRRKYIPLGLAKIATFAKRHNIDFQFQRNYEPIEEDLICMTSLFTYDSEKVNEAIEQIRFLNPKVKILLGGIYASLMKDKIQEQYPIEIFKGYSKELDAYPPDYETNWHIEEPWNKFSFVFTSRGCPNKCGYCAVWRLEPDMWINPSWKEHIDLSKPNVMISDNNLSAQPIEHIEDVCKFLIDHKLKVVFDNGFDCKHITENLAGLLGKLKFVRSGMRLAFDRIEENGIFQAAIEKLKKAGVPKDALMAYCLFNFKDTPQEADYRMQECNKLGIRPYPQQYTPLNKTSREPVYVSSKWTKNLLRIFRYFWLMRGFNTKMTFEEYALQRIRASNDKMQMTKEDWNKWYGQKDNSNIRRLTPIECERLQGFSNGWTEGLSDTQRYKCLGNAVSVPVVREIGRRLLTNE